MFLIVSIPSFVLNLKIMKTIKNYFWNHEYRHMMRDLRPSLKMEVYKTFKEWGLKVNGVSDLHEQLIMEISGEYIIEGETTEDMDNRLKYSYA